MLTKDKLLPWRYKTAGKGIKRRGVYAVDGTPIFLIWSKSHREDRLHGILAANCRELYLELTAVTEELRNAGIAHIDMHAANRLLASINEGINVKTIKDCKI